jgi:phage gp16-like protein
MNRRSLLAMVHIAKKDIGLDDETYRAVLVNVSGGRDSAKDLTDDELGQVLDGFRLRGWRPTRKGKAINRRSDKPYVRKVWAIWGEMHRAGLVKGEARAALRSFVTRMTGVTDPEWLDPKQGSVVIEALKQWRERASKGVTGG